MRLPKLRGGTSSRNKSFNVIHLSDLEKIALGGTTDITLEILVKGGYVRGKNPLVKLLSGGEITQAVTLSLQAASATALAAVEKAGGSITILS